MNTLKLVMSLVKSLFFKQPTRLLIPSRKLGPDNPIYWMLKTRGDVK